MPNRNEGEKFKWWSMGQVVLWEISILMVYLVRNAIEILLLEFDSIYQQDKKNWHNGA